MVYPRPDPISTKQTEWVVFSEEFPERYDLYIQKHGAVMCLTPKDYENISSNMADVVRWVGQSQYLIELYEADRRREIESATDRPTTKE